MSQIKIIVLMNNKVLVSKIEEVGAEVGEPDCKLIDPVILKTTEEKITVEEGQVLMTPWLQSFTRTIEFMISSDKILTMADPAPSIVEKYMDLSNKP